MGKNISVWLIVPQTNLHVGNESVVSFEVIDKAIQRDVTTELPCINSSSLKGAIKEFLTAEIIQEVKNEAIRDSAKAFGAEEKQEKRLNDVVKPLFGSVKSDKTGDTQKGSAVFFDANLLFIPQQCINGKVYQLAYSDDIIKAFLQRAIALGVNCTQKMIKEKCEKVAETSISEKDFKQLCDNDSLPIIARNCLENGESVNLWYEQVLPSMSVLGTIIQTPKADDLDYLNGKIVQIGANATIGYGYCKFIKL